MSALVFGRGLRPGCSILENRPAEQRWPPGRPQLQRTPLTYNFSFLQSASTFKPENRSEAATRFLDRLKQQQLAATTSSGALNATLGTRPQPRSRSQWPLELRSGSFSELVGGGLGSALVRIQLHQVPTASVGHNLRYSEEPELEEELCTLAAPQPAGCSPGNTRLNPAVAFQSQPHPLSASMEPLFPARRNTAAMDQEMELLHGAHAEDKGSASSGTSSSSCLSPASKCSLASLASLAGLDFPAGRNTTAADQEMELLHGAHAEGKGSASSGTSSSSCLSPAGKCSLASLAFSAGSSNTASDDSSSSSSSTGPSWCSTPAGTTPASTCSAEPQTTPSAPFMTSSPFANFHLMIRDPEAFYGGRRSSSYKQCSAANPCSVEPQTNPAERLFEAIRVASKRPVKLAAEERSCFPHLLTCLARDYVSRRWTPADTEPPINLRPLSFCTRIGGPHRAVSDACISACISLWKSPSEYKKWVNADNAEQLPRWSPQQDPWLYLEQAARAGRPPAAFNSSSELVGGGLGSSLARIKLHKVPTAPVGHSLRYSKEPEPEEPDEELCTLAAPQPAGCSPGNTRLNPAVAFQSQPHPLSASMEPLFPAGSDTSAASATADCLSWRKLRYWVLMAQERLRSDLPQAGNA